jgi:hypothetical protein
MNWLDILNFFIAALGTIVVTAFSAFALKLLWVEWKNLDDDRP